ncbi:MAG TPA: polysaccharide deacetylase family protein [Solirubrobacteraceae bacterium]
MLASSARAGSRRLSTPLVLAAAAALAALSGCGGHGTPAVAPATAAAATVERPAATRRAALAVRERRALVRFARLGLPVYCGGSRRRVVALTFDDGPGVYTKLALRILGARHRRATFFLVGRNIAQFPRLAARDAQHGALGDHTWTHPFLPGLSTGAIHAEMARTQARIRRSAHVPVSLFRPPYGAHDAAVDRTARRLRMVEILWNVDSRDSLGANWLGIAHNVRAGLHAGAIILMHENRGQTIRALKFKILPLLRRRHYHAVTIPELMALDPPTRAQLRAGPRGCRGIRSGGPAVSGG